MSGVPRLELAWATVDLLLVRHEHSVGVAVLRREGDIQIMVVTEPRPPSLLEPDGEP